ncbi:hypothetical protein KEM48_013528 [Puccinia striiformis f. sp. tritici PST-130]|nr:hypothetical protein KEM48_013528 [Puccinia striiformis f. sp. tritici PST-130]
MTCPKKSLNIPSPYSAPFRYITSRIAWPGKRHQVSNTLLLSFDRNPLSRSSTSLTHQDAKVFHVFILLAPQNQI